MEDGDVHVELARLRKAQRIIAIIDVNVGAGDWNTSLAAAQRMTEGQWLGIAYWDAQIRNPNVDLSRVESPSAETRRVIVRLLKDRLRTERQLRKRGVLR